MKKLIKNKYIKIAFLIISLLLYNFSVLLVKQLTDLDELWNFNFANNVANGLCFYKDFNMVQMPLLPIISSVFLKIFGQEIIVMRLLAVILITYIEVLIFIILDKINVKDYIKYICLIFIVYIITPYLAIDYNYFILAILLTIIYLEIKSYIKTNKILELNFKIDFIIGILIGLGICTKQSTGLIIGFGALGYKIIEIRSKQCFKKFTKIISIRLVGILIPISFIILYLLINGAISDFISYAVLGIKTFSNNISYLNLINNSNVIIKILSIIVPIIIIISIICYIKKQNKLLLILSLYTIVNMVVIYPIADNIHFLIGILPIFIILGYYIDSIIKKFLLYDKLEIFMDEFLKISVFLTSIIICIYSINIYKTSNKIYELEHFKYIVMSENYIESIKNVSEYINLSSKKVYILDATAALYMIPINRYNKDYDMFLKGNLGKDGEKGQIEKIENEKNAKFLIMNYKYNRNWQNPEEVRNFIINNKVKTGELGVFEIYE